MKGRLRVCIADAVQSGAHLAGLGHRRLEIDGEWGEHTAPPGRVGCWPEPTRKVRTFRLIVGATQQRTPEEVARAQADGAAYAQRLRHHFAHEQPTPQGDGGAPPAARCAPSAPAAGASNPVVVGGPCSGS
jgi:hypothetical protein